MRIVQPGEGPNLCAWPAGCRIHEIDGLEFCLQHVPDDLLEEAEDVSGHQRCRRHFGQDDACRQVAVKGTSPPACKNHGANLGSVKSKQASMNVVQGRVSDRLTEIMGEHGDRLLRPRQLGNPLEELLQLAREMAEWKDIMREITVYLLKRNDIRAGSARVGEQIRAEVLLYERAQERLAAILLQIQRAGIEAALARITAEQAKQVDTALRMALTATGLPLVEQEQARQVLRRELVKATA